VLRDGPGISIAYSGGGPHPGGAQFAYADGSIRMVRFETPQAVVSALMSTRGGEVVATAE
jgi:prepilin-type processing-associated H-X9-DG protein